MVTKKLFKMQIVLLIIIIIMGGNCTKNKLFKDDELSTAKEPYIGNQLRTDGYYYQENDGKFYTMYCFYRNGIVLYLGGGIFIKSNNRIRK